MLEKPGRRSWRNASQRSRGNKRPVGPCPLGANLYPLMLQRQPLQGAMSLCPWRWKVGMGEAWRHTPRLPPPPDGRRSCSIDASIHKQPLAFGADGAMERQGDAERSVGFRLVLRDPPLVRQAS
jgi:hypothetical protein